MRDEVHKESIEVKKENAEGKRERPELWNYHWMGWQGLTVSQCLYFWELMFTAGEASCCNPPKITSTEVVDILAHVKPCQEDEVVNSTIYTTASCSRLKISVASCPGTSASEHLLDQHYCGQKV